jgi:hypothetical protein
MKSEPAEKKKTLKLKIGTEADYKLIGISSHENDYRLVWSINNELKMKFVRIDNLIMHHKKLNSDLEFSRFIYHDEDRYLKYYFFANRCPDGILFSEIKNIDFLIQITGEISNHAFNDLIKKLKSVAIVSAVFVLQPVKIKGIGQIFHE